MISSAPDCIDAITTVHSMQSPGIPGPTSRIKPELPDDASPLPEPPLESLDAVVLGPVLDVPADPGGAGSVAHASDPIAIAKTAGSKTG